MDDALIRDERQTKLKEIAATVVGIILMAVGILVAAVAAFANY